MAALSIARIKRHTKTPADFLEGSEGYFMEDEVKEKARTKNYRIRTVKERSA